ncbi:DUF6473 family protein [Roseovarius nitratireducens]|uniref:DUF6473 family protein n=1 Tax=Roseovarius nitratireducens TaxID=2044597 RepID=UPI000CE1E665|nr:DUF6473 family protein [Roseovarius nitratireducens]
MAYERMGRQPLDYLPVRYPGSRLVFRGPRRGLTGAYVACIGSTGTHGSFVARPWPALLEDDLGTPCVNLGLPNAGPDVFANDAAMQKIARGARAVVLQLPCAMNLSNPFYRVHPRRNDRFVAATDALRVLYAEVDFTEFHFTRHLMRRLAAISSARFARLRAAVQEAWLARMSAVLRGLAPPVVLLWQANHAPGDGAGSAAIDADPAFVSRAMLDALAPHAAATVLVVASGAARTQGTRGMRFPPMQEDVAAALPGPLAHREVALALHPVLTPLLKD